MKTPARPHAGSARSRQSRSQAHVADSPRLLAASTTAKGKGKPRGDALLGEGLQALVGVNHHTPVPASCLEVFMIRSSRLGHRPQRLCAHDHQHLRDRTPEWFGLHVRMLDRAGEVAVRARAGEDVVRARVPGRCRRDDGRPLTPLTNLRKVPKMMMDHCASERHLLCPLGDEVDLDKHSESYSSSRIGTSTAAIPV